MESNGDDLFNGKYSVELAIQQLRTRLLDLTGRNRLINYHHTRGRCLQFIDAPNLDLVFNKLLDQRAILLKNIPLPPDNLFSSKRPDAKTYAQSIGIDNSEEFATPGANRHAHQASKLQTAFYPAELERLCRKLRSEANTVIEETGSNMLYLVFGFLEYYEREDSEKLVLAPLLCVPISIERGSIDPETRTYSYSISYSGEDIQDNKSLREKLSREHTLHLPAYEEEMEISDYLTSISWAVRNQQRWRVRYQLTLSFLTFGKLASWADLDPRKWNGFEQNHLLNSLFSGRSVNQTISVGEDYEIDKHPLADSLSLIYDADSAQHSALIDALAGKNLVINGPPGTGKSQTITNIIAAALHKGLKVLFVSEKLAALEVVRHRLDQADLGHFCLELHSHKTQKKKLLEDIQKRLLHKFQRPQQLDDQLTSLNRQKQELNTYAQLMASCLGNELGLSVHEVFWRAEHYRTQLGISATMQPSLILPQANKWTLDEIERKRSKLAALKQLLTDTGPFGSLNPWWGFTPRLLKPGDEQTIGQIVANALEQSTELVQVVSTYVDWTGLDREPSLDYLTGLKEYVDALPTVPSGFSNSLINRVFDGDLAAIKHRLQSLRTSFSTLRQAKQFHELSLPVLKSALGVTYELVKPLLADCVPFLKPETLAITVGKLNQLVQAAETASNQLAEQVTKASFAYSPVNSISLSRLEDILGEITQRWRLQLHNQPNQQLQEGLTRLTQESQCLSACYQRFQRMLVHYNIPHDDRLITWHSLSKQEGLPGLRDGVVIDENVRNKVQATIAMLDGSLRRQSWLELNHRRQRLLVLKRSTKEQFTLLQQYAEQLDFSLKQNEESVGHIVTMAKLASEAPPAILLLRQASFPNPRLGEFLQSAQALQASICQQRDQLAKETYLDTLPDITELQAALRFVRQSSDSIFNIFNGEWRRVRKLLNGVSRTQLVNKVAVYQELLERLVKWRTEETTFKQHPIYVDVFGTLFQGAETDFVLIGQLYEWFTKSQARIRQEPELLKQVDLTIIEPERIHQYAQLAPAISQTASKVLGPVQEMGELLNVRSEPGNSLLGDQFDQQVDRVTSMIAERIQELEPLLDLSLSPERSLEVVAAAIDCKAMAKEVESIQTSVRAVKEQVETYLPGIADLPSEFLKQHIDQLQAIIGTVQQLLGLVLPMNIKEATPLDVRNLIASKCEVEACLSQFAQVPASTEASGWTTFASLLHIRIAQVNKLASLLLSAANTENETFRQVVDGLRHKHEAKQRIELLEHDPLVMDMLAEQFIGLATEDDPLEATLNWGEAVLIHSPVGATELCDLLVHPEGTSNLSTITHLLDRTSRLIQSVNETLQGLSALGSFSWEEWNRQPGEQTSYLTASSIQQHLLQAMQASDSVLVWSQYHATRQSCEIDQLLPFVKVLEEQQPPTMPGDTLFQYAVYWSIASSIQASFPILQRFTGTYHANLRSDFAALDKTIIQRTGKAFAYHIDQNKKVPSGLNSSIPRDKTQLWLLYHELGKQKRHIPIRQLIKRAGEALQGLKPCFMMGPLAVAQYLEPGSVEFDLIVMDEASQLRPEDALGAIARGKQLIVVGDPKQLPPTNFFDRIMEEDDDEAEAQSIIDGSESILDICQQLFHPVRNLKWHYRSQHESLIAFSNHHFYDGKLIIFPSPFAQNNQLGVRYRYIRDGVYIDRQNVKEAHRVSDAVLEHMLRHPDESLGVVTLNQTQRELVEELVESKLRDKAQATAYRESWDEKGLPFFVKNLENVQGDERDVIYISTTFGKAPNTNQVRQNFGPISRPDGWRRLNVLFTRARRKLHLFTSMLPEDIFTDERTPRGTKALRDYLMFAQQRILSSASSTGRQADSDFELSVRALLQSQGYEVESQLGVAGFFIDLAVRNPDRPGEFLAAIECDGATYHSSKSARDRDRIRQNILESLGWKDRIWRIWSTDWFYTPRRESERLLSFLNKRRAIAKAEPELLEETFPEDEIAPEVDVIKEMIEEIKETPSINYYVQVGDQVTFCYLDKVNQERVVWLVDGEADVKQNQFNKQSALGEALFNSCIGDEKQLIGTNATTRTIRVLAISRLT